MAKRSWSIWIGVVLVGLLTVAVGATDRTGAYLDEIIFQEVATKGAAVDQLIAGEIDVYAYPLDDAELLEKVRASSETDYRLGYGGFNDLTFNPGGPVFNNGNLNPFAVPDFREAINWLIDREYIADEISQGLATAKYSYLNSAFPDAERYRDIMDDLEDYYATDVDRAYAVMTDVLEELGAVKVGNTWQYNGSPVEIIALIRIEDTRMDIGQYVAGLLEEFGFVVDRRIRKSSELSPLWISSAPMDGLWHFYTGGWVTTAISRDQGTGFNQFYTSRILPWPLFTYLTEDMVEGMVDGRGVAMDDLWDTLDKLYNRDFTTMDERELLFEDALWGTCKFANIMWLVDNAAAASFRSNVTVGTDLSGGIHGSQMWAKIAYFQNEDGTPQEGGTLRVATNTLLIEPFNPVNGTNWSYDQMVIRAMGDDATGMDINTGLVWPLYFDRAEVTVQEGLPVGVSDGEDWCTLTFEPEIAVPTDAWADWDATTQTFITVGEKYPDGVTAKRKSVVYYPESLYDVPLHDGSTISIADFILSMIMTFDQAKPESAIYDESAVPGFDSFMSAFRGVKIVSENPLIIETYSDLYTLDAENGVSTWFPYYDQGPGFWHVVTLGILAEELKLTSFSEDKAQALSIQWLDLTKGPSIPILYDTLMQAWRTSYIPYEPTLGQYVTPLEAQTRWVNLEQWYNRYGHFWVTSAPFYLEKAYPTEKNIVLKRFADYPFESDKWQFMIDMRDERWGQ